MAVAHNSSSSSNEPDLEALRRYEKRISKGNSIEKQRTKSPSLVYKFFNIIGCGAKQKK